MFLNDVNSRVEVIVRYFHRSSYFLISLLHRPSLSALASTPPFAPLAFPVLPFRSFRTLSFHRSEDVPKVRTLKIFLKAFSQQYPAVQMHSILLVFPKGYPKEKHEQKRLIFDLSRETITSKSLPEEGM